jgi:hypothetical protein
MGQHDSELARLLRSAASSPESEHAEMPFGFDARVVARWRAQRSNGIGAPWEFARMFKIVGVMSILVTVLASAGAWWQFKQNKELGEPLTNAYAIADTAIDAGVLR